MLDQKKGAAARADKLAGQLQKEVRLLQEALADNNIIIDKVIPGGGGSELGHTVWSVADRCACCTEVQLHVVLPHSHFRLAPRRRCSTSMPSSVTSRHATRRSRSAWRTSCHSASAWSSKPSRCDLGGC